MKKLFSLSVVMLLMFCLLTACSDDNEPGPSKNQEIESVINKLEEMKDVDEFAEVLKNVTDINIGDDVVTVFAVQNKSNLKNTKAASTDSVISANNIKRHIVKGAHSFSSFTADSLILESLSGDKLMVTKYEGKILINGIALISSTPTAAGKSYIYMVPEVIPNKENTDPSPLYKSGFIAYDCNEAWVSGAAEKNLSENTKITFYRLVDSKYQAIDSIFTDKEGKAEYNHSFTDLLYTITKGDKQQLYDGYLVAGIFTSQAEIDNAPQYPSSGLISNPKPGSVKVVDANEDGKITDEDKFTSPYFNLDIRDEAPVEVTLISADFEPKTDYKEKYSQITDSLKESLTSFLQMNYRIDYMLMKPTIQYPALNNLPDIWSVGYTFINNLNNGSAIFSNQDCPADIKADWNAKEIRYKVEMAYIYSCLTNYYGGVSIVTDSAIPLPARSTVGEVADYIYTLTDNIINESDADNRNAAIAIAMRLAANQKEYARVKEYAKMIIDGGKYALSANNVSDTGKNIETIFGGFALTVDSARGKFIHPIRYSEVILSYAEACNELGNSMEATMATNQILAKLNMAGLPSGLSQNQIRMKIIDTYGYEFNFQALGYMFIKRWNTFGDVLGGYGAIEKNKVIPIPDNVLTRYPGIITQNPGY